MMQPEIKIVSQRVLSEKRYKLKEIELTYQEPGKAQEQYTREVFDRGNGAAILLYNQQQNTVILIRQFRLPTFLNANPNGMLIEACAGTLEEVDPEACIKREVIEETGYHIDQVEKVMEVYPSPGAVTEILHLYIAPYEAENHKSNGGGLANEHEHIQVLEVDFSQAIQMMKSGEIKDGKTIILLQYLQLNGILKTK